MKAAAFAVPLALCALSAMAQAPITEIDVTAGYSTEGIGAVTGQVRAFGEAKPDLRYYLEGSWGDRTETTSDAFGAAYPYDKRLTLMEGYVEKRFSSKSLLGGLKVGRFRPPFGISSRSDYAYNGFLRAPLIRYGESDSLSNFWTDGGADFFIGTPQLLFEASVGAPQERESRRRGGTSSVLRAQAYRGDWIVGASYIDTPRVRSMPFADGRARFTGIDARWMDRGVQLRGEWISGKPFNDTITRGWYIDGIVHRLSMGNVTGIARVEQIDYKAEAPFAFKRRRYTLGAKAVLSRSWVGEIDAIRQSGFSGSSDAFLDFGLTYSIRR
jgi:hypothetical protein